MGERLSGPVSITWRNYAVWPLCLAPKPGTLPWGLLQQHADLFCRLVANIRRSFVCGFIWRLEWKTMSLKYSVHPRCFISMSFCSIPWRLFLDFSETGNISQYSVHFQSWTYILIKSEYSSFTLTLFPVPGFGSVSMSKLSNALHVSVNHHFVIQQVFCERLLRPGCLHFFFHTPFHILKKCAPIAHSWATLRQILLFGLLREVFFLQQHPSHCLNW